MKNISLYLYTFFKGNLVGKDKEGNKYYTSNISHGIKKEKRWVLYKNDNDPTSIDPGWHSWLHHIIKDVPNLKKKNFYWQKKISPNYTGTEKAYLPPGHILSKERKTKKIKNYESWIPDKKR